MRSKMVCLNIALLLRTYTVPLEELEQEYSASPTIGNNLVMHLEWSLVRLATPSYPFYSMILIVRLPRRPVLMLLWEQKVLQKEN